MNPPLDLQHPNIPTTTTTTTTTTTNTYTTNSNTNNSTNIMTVIRLAEVYFDRFDSTAFLDLVPPTVPLSMLSTYLNIVLEFQMHKKKNLEVCENNKYVCIMNMCCGII